MSIEAMKQALEGMELVECADDVSKAILEAAKQYARTAIAECEARATEQAEKQSTKCVEPVMRRTTREEKIVRPGIYEVMRDVLSTTPPAAQAAPVKVWEAEGYDALMKEMQMVKARNIRQHAEIERLSALVRAQQITIEKLEAQPPAAPEKGN